MSSHDYPQDNKLTDDETIGALEQRVDNLLHTEIPSSVFSGSTTSQYTERRKSLVALPPAMADMLRHIAEDMERQDDVRYVSGLASPIPGSKIVRNHYLDAIRVDANSLRNIADLLDAIAVQSGQMPLRVERRNR